MLLSLLALFACAPRHLTMPGPADAMELTPVQRWDRVPGVGRAPTLAPELRAEAVARAAASLVGTKRLEVDGQRYRWDCSGFVEAAYAATGVVWRGSSSDMWAQAGDAGERSRRRRAGRVGDVVFFDDTWDQDGDGRNDDDLTHVGIVERVERPGVYVIIHLVRGGVQRLRMDLRERHVHKDPEPPHTLRNDFLRARTKKDRRRTRYLAGELWRGFGSPWALALPPLPQPARAPRGGTLAAAPS